MATFPEMSDEKAVFAALLLIKNICLSFDSSLVFDAKNDSTLEALVRGSDAESVSVLKDPVVKAFLNHVVWLDGSGSVALYNACRANAQKNLGFLYEHTPSPGMGGSNLIKAMRENSLDGLSKFVSMIGPGNLERIIERTMEGFNFIEGGDEIPLYGINLAGNFIVSWEEEYEMYFTGDDTYNDVLNACSIDQIFPRVHEAIQFELDKLAKIECTNLGTNYRNTTFFNGVVITRNGEELIKVPLIFDGYDPKASPSIYDLEFRSLLNEKGAKAYSLDFDNLEVIQGSSRELKRFARGLPRRAAMRLNGTALEDDLGM